MPTDDRKVPVMVVTPKGRSGAPPDTSASQLEINFIGEFDEGDASILLIREADVPVLSRVILDALFLSRAEMRALFKSAVALAVIKSSTSHIMADWENGEWQLRLCDEDLH